MNIDGLDYNTQREQLILPEYGREIQKMVDYCVTLPTKQERQLCAKTIVSIMRQMTSANQNAEDFNQKLWDHLAIMSRFQLDIDYPYDISQAEHISSRPDPVPYPNKDIPVRHYGNMMFEIFEALKTMPEGPVRTQLIQFTANQMKRNLNQWGHGSADDEKVVSDLAKYTDGVVQVDLGKIKFEKMPGNNNEKKRKRK